MANRDKAAAAGQTAMGAAMAGAVDAPATTAAVNHAVDTAGAVADKRDIRIVFSKPWTSDGSETRKLKDGDILANAAVVNLPIVGMQISGIGVKRMARDRTLAITMPSTAGGMVPVVGGRMEKLAEAEYDARMRLVTERMARGSAVSMKRFADLILDAWAMASKLENPFNDDGVAVDL